MVQLIQYFLPYMSSPSHIVTISTIGGLQGVARKFPNLTAYLASKAAVINLTECLASELEERKISFNCLALSMVDTDMLREAFPDVPCPMTPEKIAEFIANFVLTGHQFFNGKVLPIAML